MRSLLRMLNDANLEAKFCGLPGEVLQKLQGDKVPDRAWKIWEQAGKSRINLEAPQAGSVQIRLWDTAQRPVSARSSIV